MPQAGLFCRTQKHTHSIVYRCKHIKKRFGNVYKSKIKCILRQLIDLLQLPVMYYSCLDNAVTLRYKLYPIIRYVPEECRVINNVVISGRQP